MCDCDWFNSGSAKRDYLSHVYGVGEVGGVLRETFVLEYIDETESPLKGTVNGVDADFVIVTKFVTTHDYINQSVTYRSALEYEASGKENIKFKAYKLYFTHTLLGGATKYYVFEASKEPTKTIDDENALTLDKINKDVEYDNDDFQIAVLKGNVYGFTENEFGMLVRNNNIDPNVRLAGTTIVGHLFGATNIGINNSKLVGYAPTMNV